MRRQHILSRLLIAVLAGLACLGAARAQQSNLQTQGGETTIAKQVSPDKSLPLLLQANDLVYDNRKIA